MRGIAACVCAVATVAGLDARQVVFRAGVDLVTFGVTGHRQGRRPGHRPHARRFRDCRGRRRPAPELLRPGRRRRGARGPAPGPVARHQRQHGARPASWPAAPPSSSSTCCPQSEDITLVDFDTEVRVTRYPQRDFPRLVERIRNRKPDGWTALYDALGVYLDGAAGQQGRPRPGDVHRRRRLALVAVSSRRRVELLKASHATVYAIGLVREHRRAAHGVAAAPAPAGRDHRRPGLLPAQPEGGGAHLRAGADRDSRRSTSSATSRPTPPPTAAGARSRSRSSDPGLKVRARKGYFAPYKPSR